MECGGCGASAPALKTVRWRKGERLFPLCDRCYAPLAGHLWIVVGPVPAHGTCRSCGHWYGVGELVDPKPGGRRDAPSGLCSGCVRECG